uniref:Uncharacterized protein n=1 Tax=Magnetococcus massalia (strain MO-1) TaxID=451514 RepID=A0A1S7LH58_MAGMO|nr:protein of unknown function [Candidatus Magnetococcus massalia]
MLIMSDYIKLTRKSDRLLARIFHAGWPEGGSRPAMARRGVKWIGEYSGSFVSDPFDTATQPARSMGPHNGYPS